MTTSTRLPSSAGVHIPTNVADAQTLVRTPGLTKAVEGVQPQALGIASQTQDGVDTTGGLMSLGEAAIPLGEGGAVSTEVLAKLALVQESMGKKGVEKAAMADVDIHVAEHSHQQLDAKVRAFLSTVGDAFADVKTLTQPGFLEVLAAVPFKGDEVSSELMAKVLGSPLLKPMLAEDNPRGQVLLSALHNLGKGLETAQAQHVHKAFNLPALLMKSGAMSPSDFFSGVKGGLQAKIKGAPDHAALKAFVDELSNDAKEGITAGEPKGFWASLLGEAKAELDAKMSAEGGGQGLGQVSGALSFEDLLSGKDEHDPWPFDLFGKNDGGSAFDDLFGQSGGSGGFHLSPGKPSGSGPTWALENLFHPKPGKSSSAVATMGKLFGAHIREILDSFEKINFQTTIVLTSSGSGHELIDKTAKMFSDAWLANFNKASPAHQKALLDDWMANGVTIAASVHEKSGGPHAEKLKFRPMKPGETVQDYIKAASKWAAKQLKEEAVGMFGIPSHDITKVQFTVNETAMASKQEMAKVNFQTVIVQESGGSGHGLIEKTEQMFAQAWIDNLEKASPAHRKALIDEWKANGVSISVEVYEKSGGPHKKTFTFRPMKPGETVEQYIKAAADWASDKIKKEATGIFGLPSTDITKVKFSVNEDAYYPKPGLKPGLIKPGLLGPVPGIKPPLRIPLTPLTPSAPAPGSAPTPGPGPVVHPEAPASKNFFHIGDVHSFVMYVIRASYLENSEELKYYAQKVQFFNALKKQIRGELENVKKEMQNYAGKDDDFPVVAYDTKEFSSDPMMVDGQMQVAPPGPGMDVQNKMGLEKYMENLESKLSSVGDDAQLANTDLQNWLQKQQQALQMLSNMSKSLHDTALNTIRKLGG